MNISRSVWRWGLIAAALVTVFTVVGFFVLPPIIKGQLEKRLSLELGRVVKVGKVQLNPYALSLTLEKLAITEPNGTTLFLGWERLHVNFDALSSLHGEWVLSEVMLAGFEARVRVNPDQSLNFSDVLAKFAPPTGAPAAPSKSARPVRVVRLQVSGARLDVADLSRLRPFATLVGPLSFDLTEFRTVSERGAPYRFEGATEAGEKFAWSGTLRAEPFRSVGELSLENIALPKYAPFYAELMQAELVAGKLSVRGRYEIDLTAAQPILKISDTSVQVRGITLRERATNVTALELTSVDLDGVQVDALSRKATIASLALAGGNVRVRREKDASINLLTMLQPTPVGASPLPVIAPAPAPAVSPAASAKAPEVAIAEITLKDFEIGIADLAAPRPVQLALNALQLSLKNVTLAEGAGMPLALAFGWAPQGTLRVSGDVSIAPIQANLKIEGTGLELLPLSPYLEQFANVHLTQGATTLTLETHLSLPAGKPLVATIAGDVKVEKLGFVDAAHNEELAGFGELTLRGLRAGSDPAAGVTLEELNVVGPYARVIVNADKSLNLAAIAKTGSASPAATAAASTTEPLSIPGTPAPGKAPPPAAAPVPPINVGKITIRDGDFRFTDRSIEPNVAMAINRFGGTITGLSSTNPAKAEVDLKAAVDGAGPVAITGKLDPLGANKTIDLQVDFKNVDLHPLSPYSGKFAGYELARGKLALDVKVLVEGKKIDAANVITLHQFTFGQPVKSADATALPVRLGIALLKDTDGKIVIDVPVQGNTDDPNFRIGRVVLRVIVNLLTKAAVSPFSLIGAAFGGGGDELAYQEFAPGSAELQPAEIRKLQTMTQALTNRPGLSVGLEGSHDAAADAYALKRVKVAGQVRRTVWETKHLADPNIPPPSELVISPDESAAAIKKLYDEKFPPGTQFGTPLPSPPAVVTPPEPPASLYKRVVRAITFQAKREQRVVQQENARLSAEHAQAMTAALAASRPVAEMSGRLAEATPIDENDLRALAHARAQQVRDYLATTGKIAADRVFLAQATTAAPAEAAANGKGPRVFLQLQ